VTQTSKAPAPDSRPAISLDVLVRGLNSTRELGTVRGETCARLRADAPLELVQACKNSDFGDQMPELSLDGVAACPELCAPEHTCGKVLMSCQSPESSSALRCDVTHSALKIRGGNPATGPHSAPYRVFVVSTPCCLRRRDGGMFADDAAAVRLLTTFPEKLIVGDSPALTVAMPKSWKRTLSGSGSKGFSIPGDFRLPPGEDNKVPVVSVFRSSTARKEVGFRVTTTAALANLLHTASAREPTPRSGTGADRPERDALFSAQPSALTFTVMCRAGGSGLGAIVIKTLGTSAAQTGRPISSESGGGTLRVPKQPSDREVLADTRPGARWIAGSDAPSPISGATAGALNVAWVCLTVDTWTGRVTDCREVLIGEKGTVVSRTRDPAVVVDLSSELMVNVVGIGGVALGIGRAEVDIFGSPDAKRMSLFA
jgi:hypothetical protein